MDFPFLTALLADRDFLHFTPEEVYTANYVAHGISDYMAALSLQNGVAVLALLLYSEQFAEKLAQRLNYNLGPQAGS